MKVIIHDLGEEITCLLKKTNEDLLVIHADQSVCSLPRLLQVLAEKRRLLRHEGFSTAHWSTYWKG